MPKKVILKAEVPVRITIEETPTEKVITILDIGKPVDPYKQPYPWFLNTDSSLQIDLNYKDVNIREINDAINFLTNIKKVMEEQNA